MILAVEEVELKTIIRPEDEVTLLGAIESDGIPTDYGQVSDDPSAASEEPEWQPGWCKECEIYDCGIHEDREPEIDGQVSLDDLEAADAFDVEDVSVQALQRSESPEDALSVSVMDAGF
jgi:hypothetical protein